MKIKEDYGENMMDFAELEAGDCFKWRSDLYIKTDYEQDAVRLSDGLALDNMCDKQVTPINVEVQIIN